VLLTTPQRSHLPLERIISENTLSSFLVKDVLVIPTTRLPSPASSATHHIRTPRNQIDTLYKDQIASALYTEYQELFVWSFYLLYSYYFWSANEFIWWIVVLSVTLTVTTMTTIVLWRITLNAPKIVLCTGSSAARMKCIGKIIVMTNWTVHIF
jgi:hypothetical protein